MDLYELIKLAKAYAELDFYEQQAIEGLGAGHPVCDFDGDVVAEARKFLSEVAKTAEDHDLDRLQSEAQMLVDDIDTEKASA
jgi:hypothetical protein